jgi:hypothetical protein
MTPNGESRYRVIFPEVLREQIRRWGREATQQGIGPDVAAALRGILERLTLIPLEWGDPLYRLHAMELLVFRGLHAMFYVYDAVSEARRMVYVLRFLVVPGHPLEGTHGQQGP